MLQPLAFRVRPNSLEDIIGQEHLVKENGFLYNSIKAETPISFILYGTPGVGKTTIAIAYAKSLKINYIKLNAVTSNKKDIEKAIEEAKNNTPTIVIIDEIHRLNKDKQDILLPFVEEGIIYLIGCTTANPFISINKAIRSRCHLLEVKPLTNENIVEGLKRAIKNKYGFNNNLNISDEALNYIAKCSNGDFRFALNFLEIASITFKDKEININNIKEIKTVNNSSIDKDDDGHYDAVSAMQKSIRGSDVNASLYYACRLLVAGDLDSLTRRLLITAYEDIGLANPSACMRTKIAIDAAYQVGLPEAIIPLGVAICDLALSPKSKSACEAIEKAYDLASKMPLDVLPYLKLTPANLSEEMKYPYDNEDIWIHLQYLPEIIKNKEFFVPSLRATSTYEKYLNDNYEKLKSFLRSSNMALLKKKYPKI